MAMTTKAPPKPAKATQIRHLLPHPIAMEFPEIGADEFNDLVASIREDGFDPSHPIVLFEGKILDGRNRYRAVCEVNKTRKGAAPIEPTTREFKGTYAQAVAFSVRENLLRRHLSAGQRAMIADAIATAKRGGDRRSETAQEQTERNETRSMTVEAVAAKVHVAPRTVASARELRALDPAAATRVKDGKETLHSALRKAKVAAGSPTKAPPKPAAARVDAAGRPMHPAAAAALTDGAALFSRLNAMALALGRGIKDLCTSPEGRLMQWAEIKTDLDNIRRVLRYAAPHTSCPMGDPCDDDCRLCRGTQWIGESQWDNVPDDIKRRTR